MLDAVMVEGALAAPTVGTWSPRVGVGAPLAPGLLLGRIRRADRWLDVTAPAGAAGVVTHVAAGGAWVEYGAALVEVGEAIAAGGPGLGPSRAGSVAQDVPDGVIAVRADTDGTVYLSPEPTAPLFAAAGAAVASKATLALVEVMKTFTPVRSPVAGTVERVLVASGASVQAGAPLFWIRPGPA